MVASTKTKGTRAPARRKAVREHLGPGAAFQDARRAWRQAVAANGGIFSDEIARQFTAVPPEVVAARRAEAIVAAYRRTIERAFVLGTPPAGELDFARDIETAQAVVDSVIRARGRSGHHLRQVGTDPRTWYASLSATEQGRVRVALMRLLEEATRGLASRAFPSRGERARMRDVGIDEWATCEDPWERAMAVAVCSAPFDLDAFADEDLEMLRRVWANSAPGAKRSGTGERSKWAMLHKLLRQTWGCTKTPRALETEWTRRSPAPWPVLVG